MNDDGSAVGRKRPLSVLAAARRVMEVKAADPGGTVEAFTTWNKE